MSHNLFEQAKQHDEHGVEFWSARTLQDILEYSKWENFHRAIERAMTACKTAGYEVADHFPEVRKMVVIGSGAQREQTDYRLSRYASQKSGFQAA